MTERDERIDAYIARAAPFARPILAHLRALVHEACPEVGETIKWSAPHFMHGGRILAGMAAFKQHAAFIVPMLERKAHDRSDEAMGQYGRLASLADLPAKRTLLAQLRQAANAIDAGEKRPTARRSAPRAALPVPDDFAEALSRQRKAAAVFEAFPPSHRRDYIEWIVEAKREDTRSKRIAQAVEWIAEGRQRNWKYQKK